MRTAVVNIGDIGAICRVRELTEHLALHHLGETDDRVQRGAQLVADGGEEGGFCPVGRLRLLPRGLALNNATIVAQRNPQPDAADQGESDQRDRGGL